MIWISPSDLNMRMVTSYEAGQNKLGEIDAKSKNRAVAYGKTR